MNNISPTMAHSNFVARTHTSEQVTLHMKFKIVKIVHMFLFHEGALVVRHVWELESPAELGVQVSDGRGRGVGVRLSLSHMTYSGLREDTSHMHTHTLLTLMFQISTVFLCSVPIRCELVWMGFIFFFFFIQCVFKHTRSPQRELPCF